MSEGFQPARTVASVIVEIESQQIVLPAIQREFVWNEQKITALFDSLMRGYPIGGFLYWRVSDETTKEHAFYGFIRDYSQKPPNNLCPRIQTLPPSDSRYAVLDGQQRLTALNIGLRGSHAVKLPKLWWDNPAAFPSRHLYLDLSKPTAQAEDSGADDETGETEGYVFRFRTPEQAAAETASGTRRWMRVSDILDLPETTHVIAYISKAGIGTDNDAMEILGRLQDVVHNHRVISPFIEPDQSIDRVMNIFIRVNAQGEPLSFADLLLSQATAAWSSGEGEATVDAREEIRAFNDQLNCPDHRFDFKRDQIMKACLVLTDAASVRFRIENFKREQMLVIREAWPSIKSSLDLAVGLLDQFGLTAANLNARSVIHPVAYYVKHRSLDGSYLTAKGAESDREIMKRWIIRTLLRQGIWGSGLDTLLTRLRAVIKEGGANGFPAGELEQTMGEIGKSLAFDEAAVDGLLALRYGERNCFALLSIIYPSGDTLLRHVDHIYPQTMFRRAKLHQAGFSEDQANRLIADSQTIGNLQLLTPADNTSKGGGSPLSWLHAQYPDEVARAAIGALHQYGPLDDDVKTFPKFFEERRRRLAAVIRKRLGVPTPEPPSAIDPAPTAA